MSSPLSDPPGDDLFPRIVELLGAQDGFSLGTVVYTAGSTPQKIGARAVFLPDGAILGTLGGGCMEAEARRRGLALTRGGDPEVLDLHLDDDFGWDDGLICGGRAEILLQPRPDEDAAVYRAALEAKRDGRPVVLAIAVSGEGVRPGRSCLFDADGAATGRLGDDRLQEGARAAAVELLAGGTEEPRRVRLRDPAVQLYLEPLLPRPVCLIAGAGHVGAAVAHYAARCGFEVAIVDDRASLCNKERIPGAGHVLVGDIVETVRRWPKTTDTYAIVVTRGHRHDAVVLRELIHEPLAYLGMIGSKRKILTIYDEFLAEGLATPEELARVHAPIGLDIGALTVEEIALCIVAELILVRRRSRTGGRQAGHASHRDCAGGGRVAEDGRAEAALALRLQHRDTDGRPLAEGLPRRPGAGRAGASRG